MFNTINFSGGLVRKTELKVGTNGKKSFIGITLARNYSEKQEDGSYKDVHTEYVNCTAFGKLAENFANSDIPLGTKLQATGRVTGRKVSAYTSTATGQTVPESSEEYVILENISPDLSMGNVSIQVTRNNNTSTTTTNDTFSQSFNETPQPAQNSFVNNTTPINSEPESKKEATDDPFADLFN